jgi:hypothetical protein
VRTEGSIVLNLPWLQDQDADRKLERWFGSHAHWGDDPDQSRYEYKPPEAFDFYDALGNIALVGCRAGGYQRDFISGAGVGRVVVTFALRGATGAQKYAKLNGLRSEIDGLGSWLNARSVVSRPVFDAESRLRTMDFHVESPAARRISRRMNLTIRPAFRYGAGEHPDETVITERMFVETDIRAARSWDEHLSLHVAVRDLLRVAAWQRLNFLQHEATRDDDPLRTLDGAAHGRQWYPVETVTTGVTAGSAGSGRASFLFTFEEIGGSGVSRWIALLASMSRAFEPILGLLTLQQATIEARWAQLGIGLEALGYLLAREQGISAKRASEQSFQARLERILNDSVLTIPSFDSGNWMNDARLAYRAVKHADNALPTPPELARSYVRGIQVFRAWLAGRLGVGSADFLRRLPGDVLAWTQ